MGLDYYTGRDKAAELGYSFTETQVLVCIDKVVDGDIICRGWFAPTRSNDFMVESYGVWVGYKHHNQGIGQKFLQDRMSIAKAMGVKAMFASVSNANAKQEHILKKYGWYQCFKLPYQNFWSVVL